MGIILFRTPTHVNAKGYATRQEGFAALLFTLVLLAFPTQLFTLHPLRARVANTLRGRFPAQHTNRLGLLAHSASSRLLPMRSLEAILFRTPTQVNAQGLLREVHAAEEGLEAGVELSGCVETTDGLVFVGVHLKNRQEAMHRQNIVN